MRKNLKRKNNIIKGLAIVIIFLFIVLTLAPDINANINNLFSSKLKIYPQKFSDEEILELRYRDSSIQYKYMTEDGRTYTKTTSRWWLFSEQAQYCEDIPLISTTSDDGNHQPIYIEGNDDFTPENGVTGGSGIEGDPYIVENWVIVYDGVAEHGIFVNNTDAYFIIRNCNISGFTKKYYAGIRLNNVENGKIEDVDTYQNYEGIYITYSSYIIISNCTSHHNNIHQYSNGIGCYYCSNITISSCECYNNRQDGIQFGSTSYSIIENSTCYNNGLDGIEIGWCKFEDQILHNIIRDCIIHHNTEYGIGLRRYSRNKQPGYTHIIRCEIYNNGPKYPGADHGFAGISIEGMHNNIVEDCNIHYNGRGIEINGCSNNIIRNCSIFSQYMEGDCVAEGIAIAGLFIFLDLSINNQIINCDIYDNEMGIWLLETLETKIYKNNMFNNSIDGIIMNFLPFAISTGSITYNNIYNNGKNYDEVGLRTDLSIVDARHNWWGSEFGPRRFLPNGGDKLITVYSFVLFRPWSTEFIPDSGRQ